MSWRWLLLAGLLVPQTPLHAQKALPGPGPPASVGYLLIPAPNSPDGQWQAVPYVPRAGDIAVYDHDNRLYHLMFKLARTKPPTHVATVIDGPDGKPALFELAGPKVRTALVSLLDVGERFRSFEGTVMVRRIREPLAPEQSCQLTQFAQSQVGRRFALTRIVLLGTPLSPRSGLRRTLFGRTPSNRHRWFCSELVVASLAMAGIIDGQRYPANATFPCDLVADDWLDLSPKYHPPALWVPEPPLPQTGQMVP